MAQFVCACFMFMYGSLLGFLHSIVLARILVPTADLYTMLFRFLFSWYLDLFRHAGNVFKGVELHDPLYARDRFQKFLVVSACQHESEVCHKVQAAFGISSSEVFVDQNVEYSEISEFAELESLDWYTFYRLDFEL